MFTIEVPHLSILGFQPSDRNHIVVVQNNLHSLARFLGNLHADLELINCANGMLPTREQTLQAEIEASQDHTKLAGLHLLHEQSKKSNRWSSIAIRDAVMQIYHIWFVIEALASQINPKSAGSVRDGLSDSQKLRSLVDHAQFKLGQQQFAKEFPRDEIVRVRDSVGHAGEISLNLNRRREHASSEEFKGSGLWTKGQNSIVSVFSNENYVVTWEGKYCSFEWNSEQFIRATLGIILIFSAFKPVAEALKFTDLGD